MRLDQQAYDHALATARLSLAIVFDWDPMQHPRDLNGRWKDVPDFDKLGDVLDRSKKGVPDNTQDLHTVQDKRGGWHYTRERNALHKAIIQAYLDGGKTGDDPPKMLFTAGGAGSGKTEGLKKTPHLLPDGAVSIDPDEIKLQLPEYKRLVEEGNPKAATLVHDESIDIAQKLLWAATEGKYNALMDGTGASPMFLSRLDRALNQGYEVEVAYFNTDLDTALKRIEERKKLTGRAVNEDVAKSMHRNASRIFEDVYNLGTGLAVYDTTGPDPVLIARAEPGADLEIDDPKAFEAFLDKGKAPSYTQPVKPKPKPKKTTTIHNPPHLPKAKPATAYIPSTQKPLPGAIF